MELSLHLKQSDDTPEVFYDQQNYCLKITGRSMPENAAKFCEPIFNWITQYMLNPQQRLDIVFDLEYFNSASARKIIEMLIAFENIADKVKVVWLHKENDDLIRERGEELQAIIHLPFEIQATNN